MKAKILDVSYDRYLADDIGAKTPTLNASVAKVLIQKSPAHAVLAHPKFNPHAEEATKAQDKGSILHSLLLNIGKGVQVVAHDNWRTKAAQIERDEARADGYIPLLLREAEEIQQASMHISRNIVELGIHLDEGKSEFMIHWESDGVQCRRSLDNWQESKLQIIELKSIFSAHPEVCESQAAKLRYDIEYAASLDAIYSLYPDLAGRVDFVFLFCSSVQPMTDWMPFAIRIIESVFPLNDPPATPIRIDVSLRVPISGGFNFHSCFSVI